MLGNDSRTHRAELIDDRGEATVASDFFRSRPHLDAEGVTHTLVLRTPSGRCALPLVVREIPGTDLLDASSPYGYPGGSLDGGAPDPADIDLSATGLVSVFVRDRLGDPCLTGGRDRGRVMLHDPARPRRSSKTFRRDVRRCLSLGYTAELRRGDDVDDAMLAGFAAAYSQTMSRVGAASRYRFDATYLRECLRHDRAWLCVVRDRDGAVAAGELVVSSDHVLHSYLAGTCLEHRGASPGKLATAELLDLADDLGTPLNHGSGLRAGDGIEASKRSYCNAELPFVTHELVCDRAVYERLADRWPIPVEDYFPHYRAGARRSAPPIPTG